VELRGQKALVVGLGVSGRAAVRFLAGRGARVWATDLRPAEALSADLDRLTPLCERLTLGGHDVADFTGADLIVVSPGVPLEIEPLRAAKGAGVEIVGELGLAAEFLTVPLIAVTGTNGKTTTVQLLGAMCAADQRDVFVGGNIGDPLIGLVADGRPVEAAVCEVSSFQIDTAPRLHAGVAVLTNITPDHLDRYADFAAYTESKLALFDRQTESDAAVLNAGCVETLKHLGRTRARRLFFGPWRSEGRGLCVDSGRLTAYDGPRTTETYSLENWRPRGGHNLENLMAAALAAREMGVSPEAVQRTIDTFALEAHRMETVGVKGGVTYVNDSKATNVDAVKRAIETFDAPIVLLLGGRDKGGDFSQLARFGAERLKSVVFFGEAGPELARSLNGLGGEVAADLPEALAAAREAARPGDVVLLSPGCASFDQYGSYAERGNHFRRLVEALS
jgi:UDP-N-acetylmuramoylalanine--D-glutamate ligase